MRLWSIHPKYLDTIGLVALWREALLGKAVLEERTIAYKNHPQLLRFKSHNHPLFALQHYLFTIWEESKKRNFRFNIKKLGTINFIEDKLPVTRGQIDFEFQHLKNKLKIRNLTHHKNLISIKNEGILPNPIFTIIDGPIESWEKSH